MKYFTIKELTRSATAQHLGIDNTPPASAVKALHALVDNVLDPLSQAWGGLIMINSGYRCPALNDAVKGVKNSQHMLGEAADITILMSNRPFGHSTDEQIARLIFNYAKEYADFDQLILEHYTDKKTGRQHWWVHISCRIDYRQNRHEKLKIENGKSKKID